MRVLVVAHGFPPSAQGGAEIYADEHARMLVHLHADDVHVLTRESRADRPEYGVRTEQRDGLSITWVNNTFRASAKLRGQLSKSRNCANCCTRDGPVSAARRSCAPSDVPVNRDTGIAQSEARARSF